MDALITTLLAMFTFLYLVVNIYKFWDSNSFSVLVFTTIAFVFLIFGLSALKKAYDESMDYCVPYTEPQSYTIITQHTRNNSWYL